MKGKNRNINLRDYTDVRQLPDVTMRELLNDYFDQMHDIAAALRDISHELARLNR